MTHIDSMDCCGTRDYHYPDCQHSPNIEPDQHPDEPPPSWGGGITIREPAYNPFHLQ